MIGLYVGTDGVELVVGTGGVAMMEASTEESRTHTHHSTLTLPMLVTLSPKVSHSAKYERFSIKSTTSF